MSFSALSLLAVMKTGCYLQGNDYGVFEHIKKILNSFVLGFDFVLFIIFLQVR